MIQRAFGCCVEYCGVGMVGECGVSERRERRERNNKGSGGCWWTIGSPGKLELLWRSGCDVVGRLSALEKECDLRGVSLPRRPLRSPWSQRGEWVVRKVEGCVFNDVSCLCGQCDG